jgi:hypothetical protein
MGRPKGSKNKPKVIETDKALVVIEKLDAVAKPKRQRKALGSSPLDKLKAAGLTVEDLKALLATPEANDKAELRKQMLTAPISPAEIAKLKKEAKAEQAKIVDPQLVVDRAVEEVIKPNWLTSPQRDDGCRHFHVKAFRHGESVSMDKERWDLALKKHGIGGVVQSSKSEDGLDETSQKVTVWRVMIG